LFELDRATQDIVKSIVTAQSDPSFLATDDIKLTLPVATTASASASAAAAAPSSSSFLRVNFGKKISVAELGRLRKSYLKLAAMRPQQTVSAIAKSFVDFLNTSGKEAVKDL
jgi:hypothetical protein